MRLRNFSVFSFSKSVFGLSRGRQRVLAKSVFGTCPRVDPADTVVPLSVDGSAALPIQNGGDVGWDGVGGALAPLLPLMPLGLFWIAVAGCVSGLHNSSSETSSIRTVSLARSSGSSSDLSKRPAIDASFVLLLVD